MVQTKDTSGAEQRLLAAAERGDAGAVMRELASDPALDVDVRRDSDRATPLVLAARAGNAELVAWLIGCAGADATLCDEHGVSPLMLTADFADPDARELVLDTVRVLVPPAVVAVLFGQRRPRDGRTVGELLGARTPPTGQLSAPRPTAPLSFELDHLLADDGGDAPMLDAFEQRAASDDPSGLSLSPAADDGDTAPTIAIVSHADEPHESAVVEVGSVAILALRSARALTRSF